MFKVIVYKFAMWKERGFKSKLPSRNWMSWSQSEGRYQYRDRGFVFVLWIVQKENSPILFGIEWMYKFSILFQLLKVYASFFYVLLRKKNDIFVPTCWYRRHWTLGQFFIHAAQELQRYWPWTKTKKSVFRGSQTLVTM